MVPFAGWSMPVQYSGVKDEHLAVRSRAGLFDVSHMGEITVLGEDAADLIQRLTPNDVTALRPGRAHYSAFLTDRGTFVDDLLVYCRGARDYLLVVNAGGRTADLALIHEEVERAGASVEVRDDSDSTALIALQGPLASEILAGLTEIDLSKIRYYRFKNGEVAGVPTLVSRTGYTGEDGFELYLPAEASPEVWRTLLAAGEPHGLVPAGLGARDTLRLEAGMMLSGVDIGPTVTPYEAGLGWIVKLGQEGDFRGRQALEAEKESGPRRRIVGFEVKGRGVARSGYPVLANGQSAGETTSGGWSPTLERSIGLAMVSAEVAAGDEPLALEVRGREVEIARVPLPFFKRDRS